LQAESTVPIDSVHVDAAATQVLAQRQLPAPTDQRLLPSTSAATSRGSIIALLALAAVQLVSIGALLAQSARRRKDRVALDAAANLLTRIAGQVGFWQWDLDTDRIAIEPAFRKLLSFDATAPAPIDLRTLIHSDDLQKVMHAAREHVAGRSATFEIQHRIIDRNKNLRWFLSRGQVQCDRDNRPVRLVGTAVDITDRKRDEDERAHVQVQLQEQRVELAHLGRAAAAGALSGALAHELRQPLSAILTNAQAAQEYLRKPNVEHDEISAILADIEAEGRRAGSIISNLRNLLRPGEEHFLPVSVGSIVNDVLTLMRGDLVARSVEVVVGPTHNVPPILAERVQLQQVMLNLINNACDALSSVDPRERRIVISCGTVDGRVHISITDNGCGLAEHRLDDIFRPFVSTKRHGLGLGLSISRSIVEAHHGKIWAERNARGGTTLNLEFPASPGTSEENHLAYEGAGSPTVRAASGRA
jgi:C4-dicarboxylate-specific signal transduction histidine kinase